ncbi:histidinol-phosphate transaminase [Streptococcus iniae]|uniref:Histidinol-phosphate aminotransferase n=1 Tax=Streptococcus iniae TaxID=1346 RepID=A0A3L8GFB8_STRIN|nr:histidinol-phosphate transaminase [Streptococcus iniae]AGM99073.1 histidinol-phosphate aminotransferase [Streptococcus iniae SF1]AHY16018.1 histidinol-phosphate aminotransferase [Streptococcus iniae]AHY17882.1 histidinol-phosphate aminotransferase [Streptococcus iniae]AJG26177.1 histidinol-phosphate aminotransferase [Streptococcus iniae]APD32055.1 histidinol-phosphate transaminase [Streptococcus iniae]
MIQGLRQMAPYIPGEPAKNANTIKLNTNENPFPPSPKVEEALKAFDYSQLRKYSPVDQTALKEAVAEHLGVSKEMLIMGSGSDEVLAMAFLAFFNNQAPLLFADVTYGFYKVLAELYHIPYQEVALADDFTIKTKDYQKENGGIVLVNPNAPTGIFKPLSEIEDIIKANPNVMVIVDEAYINFGGQSALELLPKYKNLFIVRTFSKDASLAGLRVGYGIGHPEIIQLMNAVKDSVNPYNIDSIAEVLATEAIKDWAYYQETISRICQTRDWFSKELVKLGYDVIPSVTNFLLVKPNKIKAEQLLQLLKKENILVRHYPDISMITDYLRISIGSQQDMEILLNHLKKMTLKK